jgi:hypothetical protein
MNEADDISNDVFWWHFRANLKGLVGAAVLR